VREQYRNEFLTRFGDLTRPPQREWKPREWKRGGPPRSRFPAPRPTSAQAKAVGFAGLGGHTARAVMQGLLRFPAAIADHAQSLADLPLVEKPLAELRDALLDAAMMHGALDQDQLNTILAQRGAAALMEELRRQTGLGFSFNRRDADPERAIRDLVLVIDTLAARPGLDAALDAATARLKEEGDEAAFQEQQRLRAARDEADRQLATLIESDAD
jgi:DNA primase